MSVPPISEKKFRIYNCENLPPSRIKKASSVEQGGSDQKKAAQQFSRFAVQITPDPAPTAPIIQKKMKQFENCAGASIPLSVLVPHAEFCEAAAKKYFNYANVDLRNWKNEPTLKGQDHYLQRRVSYMLNSHNAEMGYVTMRKKILEH